MSEFENLLDKLLAKFSEWIKVEDPKSKWTIEDFPYESGVDEKLTYPHCWRCVSVNKCWFVNKTDKKPEVFDSRELYHPNCHCRELAISSPLESSIKLIVPDGKVWYLFNKKLQTVLSYMGYTENDNRDEILNLIYKQARESFSLGDYKIRTINRFGVIITLFYNLPGKNLYKDKIYRVSTGWTIFPNGKIKANTLVGGIVKWNI